MTSAKDPQNEGYLGTIYRVMLTLSGGLVGAAIGAIIELILQGVLHLGFGKDLPVGAMVAITAFCGTVGLSWYSILKIRAQGIRRSK